MKIKILASAILVLTLALTACAPKAVTATKQSPVTIAKTPVSKATAAPTKAAAASPTSKPTAIPTQKPASTPTPIASSPDEIVVHDQSVKSNVVLVSMVNAAKPGWVVIATDQNGQPGLVLGHVAVPAGISNDIKVNIDASKATDKLIAMLTIDAGKIGTFEYPGPDALVKNGSNDVMAVFSNKTTAFNPHGIGIR